MHFACLISEHDIWMLMSVFKWILRYGLVWYMAVLLGLGFRKCIEVPMR